MKVLKTELYDQGFENLVSEILTGLNGERKNLLISPSDANVLVHGYRYPEFQRVLDDYAYNIPDGVPSTWVGRMKGASTMTRCAGPEFFPRILKETSSQKVNHYFIGGKPAMLERMMQVIKEDIGNHNICGYYSPPFKEFSEEEIKEMAEMANDAGADFIWVGLGAPKQLIFSHTLSKYTNCFYIAPVGAAFDFIAGNVKKAPGWVQSLGLEWAFRIFSEPKRLGRRYLNVVPRFLYYNLKESI